MIERFCALRNCVTISCSRGEHKETKKMTSKAIYIDNGINTKTLQKMLVKVDREEKEIYSIHIREEFVIRKSRNYLMK